MMRLLRKSLMLCVVVSLLIVPSMAQDMPESTPPPEPPPVPARTVNGDDFVVAMYFANLVQGNVGLLQVDDPNGQFAGVRALFREREYEFIREGTSWYGLLIADIDAQPRDYPLSIVAITSDNTIASAETSLTVENAGYFQQVFNVPADRAYLIDPQVERQEFARLDALMANSTNERLWDTRGFNLPMDAEITSAFGQYRVLNDSVLTRHTGWDQRAPVGTPVYAIASGEVVYADRLDIRGNYVLLHHGWGIYSGYAHFSQLGVQVGQRVEAGQFIGLSGNTGRSSGPHLHWEIAIQGEWIDSLAFLDLWLPAG
jgi:murein DD-endopeptidase MepM/ murein hydrolase activator NlpD